MYTLGENIIPKDIEQEIKESYLSYAMSVIVGRALPDVRDGFKPVHRRILYAMQELHLDPGKPYKKSARIVGEVLGKYHPHGDSAVYDALVRMVQAFSLRYPLVDGQGNFGSVDGDAAAAMRYTEARQAAVAVEMLRDIDKSTVDFGPNFDGSLKEPKVLPARLPNLLVNGSSGIAVGMATNIPPHNLSEALDALCLLIEEPDADVKRLMTKVSGPDFPTGGIICGREGIVSAYNTGRGTIRTRAKVQSEQIKGNRQAVVITELPYQVNKANLLETIARLVNEKKIVGISDLRDESDKDGMRVVIELKRDMSELVVLNQLYKHTQMETTFGIILLAIVDGRPRVLNLKGMLQTFIDHRREVVTRRTQFELERAEARAHILEGLKKALSHLDEVIKTIRSSKSPADAKAALVTKFEFSDRQAQAILEMQLQRLTALERDKLEAEYLELIKQIEYYQSLLRNEKLLMGVIKNEFVELKEKYGDSRRTAIIDHIADYKIEDLIADEDVVITLSHAGYIKRLPISTYRKQRRGGVGVTAMNTKEEDFVQHLFVASTHETLIFFTNKGRCYWQKVYEIPQAGRYARGTSIANLLQLQQDERLSAFINVKNFEGDKFLILATRKGTVKKTELAAYSKPRKTGIIAITLDKGDELIEALITDGNRQLLLVTHKGKAIRFKEDQVRQTGRSSRGVRGIRLEKQDQVMAVALVQDKAEILSITKRGFGKRTTFDAYRLQSRGGKGVINLKITEKNGNVIGAETVTNDDEVMLVSQEGMMVRIPVKDVRATGRAAQGVKVINLKDKDVVASVARLVKDEDESETSTVAETGKNVDTMTDKALQLEFNEELPEKKKPHPEPLVKKKAETAKQARPIKKKALGKKPVPVKPGKKKGKAEKKAPVSKKKAVAKKRLVKKPLKKRR